MIKVHPELASIIAAFHSIHPVTIHVEQTKEGFEPISMYFPPIAGFGDNDTNTSYVEVRTLSVKVFDLNNHNAMEEARKIVQAIQKQRNMIPLVDEAGNPTKGFIRFGRLDIRESNYNTAIVVLNWTSRYNYFREPYIPLEYIIMK